MTLRTLLLWSALSAPCAALAGDPGGAPPPEGTAGFSKKKSFTITDGTENNTLSISLLFQPRFELTWSPGAESDHDEVPTAGFRIRRMLVIFQGSIWRKDLTYRVRFNVGTFGTAVDASGTALTVSRPALDDARVSYRFVDPFQISVGQYKVPFVSSFAHVSVHDQAFPERMPVSDGYRAGPINLTGFSWARDLGGHVHGTVNKGVFEYQAGVFNGDGQNVWPPKDTGLLYVARVAFAPLGGFSYQEIDLEGLDPRLGFAFMGSVNRHPLFDDTGDRDGTDQDARVGSEVRFAAKHFLLYAEGDVGFRDAGPAAGPITRYGASVQASYLAGIVAPAVRYSHLDPDVDTDQDGADIVEACLNLYLPDSEGKPVGNRARLQVSWNTAVPEEGPPVHQAGVGALIGF